MNNELPKTWVTSAEHICEVLLQQSTKAFRDGDAELSAVLEMAASAIAEYTRGLKGFKMMYGDWRYDE